MNNIFDWNHISDKLSEDEREELKSYYKVYHRKSWAFKRALKRYKYLRYFGNTVSLLTASGGIATAIATGGISLSSRGNGGTTATLTSVKKNLRKLVLRW